MTQKPPTADTNLYADLKPDNIMVRLEDPSILERDARDEYDHPLPQKVVDDRTIYLSRNNYGRLWPLCFR